MGRMPWLLLDTLYPVERQSAERKWSYNAETHSLASPHTSSSKSAPPKGATNFQTVATARKELLNTRASEEHFKCNPAHQGELLVWQKELPSDILLASHDAASDSHQLDMQDPHAWDMIISKASLFYPNTGIPALGLVELSARLVAELLLTLLQHSTRGTYYPVEFQSQMLAY